MLKYFLLIPLAILAACDSPVVFEEPQPQGAASEDSFRPAYQGTYLCTGDSSILVVTEQHIYQESAHFIVDERDGHGPDSLLYQRELMGEHGLETRYFLQGHSLPLENTFVSEEMLVGTLLVRDTLFTIGPRQQVRYFRGHQLLNYQSDDGNWEVLALAQENNRDLRLFRTKLPEDIDALEAITPVQQRLTEEGEEQYLLRPSKQAFRKLLKSDLIFQECGYYEFMPEQQWAEFLF
ncbi:MAG: hypothetical protein AAF433_20600 [Bacteroidota bacterium]